MGIKSVRIQNFKSIRDTGDLMLKPLNVLIGPNGAGKSNFIGFFEFLKNLYNQELQLYVAEKGRADNFLYFGRKTSDFLSGQIAFDNEWKNEYYFELKPDQNGNLIFSKGESLITRPNTTIKESRTIDFGGKFESILKDDNQIWSYYLNNYMTSFKIFHFHDTSSSSKMRQSSGSKDYAFLYEDGSNIAAFLYRLKDSSPEYYNLIEKIIRSIAPFFKSFYLEPDKKDSKLIDLKWYENGSNSLFNAYNLSDGTLRMICLTTLLNQPDPPKTIIIDEPELGLHPFALSKLAALIKSASLKSQIIISTQSVSLIDHFTAEDIIVVNRKDKQSVFERQNSESLSIWLEDYSLGEIWDKNIIGGRP